MDVIKICMDNFRVIKLDNCDGILYAVNEKTVFLFYFWKHF